MNKTMVSIMAIAVLLVAGIGVAAVLGSGNEAPSTQSDVVQSPDVTVSVKNGYSKVDYKVPSGNLQDVLKTAAVDAETTSAGQIKAIGGITPGTDEAWTVWQWYQGAWKMIDVKSTNAISPGSIIVLFMSEKNTADGKTTYSSPDFTPDPIKIYFFVQFKEQYDKNEEVTSYLTESERRAGVWVVGTGMDAADALVDVSNRLGWDINLDSRADSKGWMYSFFGLSDEKNGDGSYTYWSQYQWVDGEWKYNNTTLGKCDSNASPYFALIRQTTDVKGTGADLKITPTDIPANLRS